ncbi:MAG TPA: SpoIID/LytB domain-containing protein [Deltaproteobacteria bacterium]|nr:SpoIID/LytB domain-containing protein [Deltaproteobacteria bacterium]
MVLGVLACSVATARMEPKVRVLLYEGSAPIRVGTPDSPATISITRAGQLRVDGKPVDGRDWAPAGAGPWRVGERRVRGEIVVRSRAGRIEVLNRVALEDYVASTVGGEMSPGWPEEALRAQAVAARTYVLHEAGRRRDAAWDVRATAASQVYRGLAAETRETRKATRSTAGEVLTWAGEPILAVFHSTAGGRTATAAEVWGEDLLYLRVVEVEDEDEAPRTYWRTPLDPEALEAMLAALGRSVGRIESIRVVARTESGRVKSLELRGATGLTRLEGTALRSLLDRLGLPSSLFDIRESGGQFVFVGSGYGHGVGMSQWGARAMAQKGVSYEGILARFYPGTRLERLFSKRIEGRRPHRVREGVGR